MEFVDTMEFDRLGVFTYSPEEDTPAAMMPEQLEETVKEDRQADLMELQQEIAFELAEEMIGKEVMVISGGDTALSTAHQIDNYYGCFQIDNYLQFLKMKVWFLVLVQRCFMLLVLLLLTVLVILLLWA